MRGFGALIISGPNLFQAKSRKTMSDAASVQMSGSMDPRKLLSGYLAMGQNSPLTSVSLSCIIVS